MAKFEPNFIDKAEEDGPFDGCLVLLNMAEEDNDVPSDYLRDISEAVSMAHADGWAVVYLFDNREGVRLAPDYLPQADGHDFSFLMSEVNSSDEADFSLLPRKRMEQFGAIVKNIFLMPRFVFDSRSAKVSGLCKIDGDDVLVPLTDI